MGQRNILLVMLRACMAFYWTYKGMKIRRANLGTPHSRAIQVAYQYVYIFNDTIETSPYISYWCSKVKICSDSTPKVYWLENI